MFIQYIFYLFTTLSAMFFVVVGLIYVFPFVLSTRESWFTKISNFTDFIEPYLTTDLKQLLPKGKIIGRGAYATVYLIKAQNPESNSETPLVVKMNNKVGIQGVEYVTYHEAAILAYLRGRAGAPRLVACEPKAGVIVMEYLGPDELTDVVRYKKIRTDRECYELMLSLSRQVQELNACGIVHADLKHNNIMVTYDGAKPVAHLIDFGFSSKIGQKSHLGYYCESWELELQVRSWYAAEIFKYEVLDEKTDIVGLAHSIRYMLSLLQCQNVDLEVLLDQAASHDKNERPPVDAFISFFEKTLLDLEDEGPLQQLVIKPQSKKQVKALPMQCSQIRYLENCDSPNSPNMKPRQLGKAYVQQRTLKRLMKE